MFVIFKSVLCPDLHIKLIMEPKYMDIHEAPCKFSDLDEVDFVELSGIKDTSKINENGP